MGQAILTEKKYIFNLVLLDTIMNHGQEAHQLHLALFFLSVMCLPLYYKLLNYASISFCLAPNLMSASVGICLLYFSIVLLERFLRPKEIINAR